MCAFKFVIQKYNENIRLQKYEVFKYLGAIQDAYKHLSVRAFKKQILFKKVIKILL